MAKYIVMYQAAWNKNPEPMLHTDSLDKANAYIREHQPSLPGKLEIKSGK